MKIYTLQAGIGQHIGDRDEQQDRVAILTAPKAPGYLMAVLADGMGGMHGGAMAAEQIRLTAKQNFEEFSPLTHDVETLLKTIVEEAHRIIRLVAIYAKAKPHTTVVLLVLTPDRQAIWGYAGDSRLYRFRGPNFAEHTIDHSHVEKLVANGDLTREQAKNHAMANVLVNGLGGQAEPYVTMGRYEKLRPGDAFLLCSDGLWHYLSGAELGAAIAMNTPRQAAEMLIGKARERAHGKGDNCSLAIIKLVGVGEVCSDD